MAFDTQDYGLFCGRVHTKFSIRLSDYKPDQMSRRLASLAQSRGATSFINYCSMLESNTTVLAEFMDTITINVTELFRNTSLFDELIKSVLPIIPAAPSSPFSAWSAGCSYGAEAYTLAIVLTEQLRTRPFKIKGTDLDLSILARANSPEFSEMDMNGVKPQHRDTFFTSLDGKSYMPKMQLKQRVSFSRHDLLADYYPTDQYDLILCRNVVIYFNDDAKERIYNGFFQALKPGGVLFVGGTERIATANKIGYEMVRPFFYQKPQQMLKAA